MKTKRHTRDDAKKRMLSVIDTSSFMTYEEEKFFNERTSDASRTSYVLLLILSELRKLTSAFCSDDVLDVPRDIKKMAELAQAEDHRRVSGAGR